MDAHTVRRIIREEIRFDRAARRRKLWRWIGIIAIAYVGLLIFDKLIEVITKPWLIAH